jgi:hypothetical protein
MTMTDNQDTSRVGRFVSLSTNNAPRSLKIMSTSEASN